MDICMILHVCDVNDITLEIGQDSHSHLQAYEFELATVLGQGAFCRTTVAAMVLKPNPKYIKVHHVWTQQVRQRSGMDNQLGSQQFAGAMWASPEGTTNYNELRCTMERDAWSSAWQGQRWKAGAPPQKRSVAGILESDEFRMPTKSLCCQRTYHQHGKPVG